jgi:outer membrane protein
MRRLIPFLILTGSLLSLAAFAQTPTPPRQPTTTPPATAAAGGTGAEGKIALINTAAFREGIQELKLKMDALNVEFDPKNKEMQSLQEQVNNLKNQINTQGSTVQPAVRQQWAEQVAEKEKELRRKEEDYQALAKKRFEEVSGPIYDKIGKFLEQYAQQRGIAMVLEGIAAQQNGVLVYAAQATDITQDFMKEYNKANPAAAAAPSPATKKPGEK